MDEELRKKYDRYGEEGLNDNFKENHQYQSWQFYKDNFGMSSGSINFHIEFFSIILLFQGNNNQLNSSHAAQWTAIETRENSVEVGHFYVFYNQLFIQCWKILMYFRYI